MSETELSRSKLSELKSMIHGDIPLAKGINIDDAKFYRKKMLSIRNPDHAINKAKARPLIEKYNQTIDTNN